MSTHDGDGDGTRPDPDGDVRDVERALSEAAPDYVTTWWIGDMARIGRRVLERMTDQGQQDLYVFRCINVALSSIAEAIEHGGLDDG